MGKMNLAMTMWKTLSNKPGGKWLFSKAIAEKAPYFKTIRPEFVELRPGYCEIKSKLRRSVKNHIGTFHAIAMCNMAEVCGGVLTEVTVPSTHRWIPKGMTVEYLQKAETDLRAECELNPIPEFGEAADLPVTVNVYDKKNQVVFRAVITMWVSPKKKQ